MSYLSIFRTNENQKQKWDSIIYEISEFVSAFFWDEAPDKYGLEAREGQQDMAFAILDAVRGNYHFAVEAGVGIGKSFAYLVPLLLYNKINAMIAAIYSGKNTVTVPKIRTIVSTRFVFCFSFIITAPPSYS